MAKSSVKGRGQGQVVYVTYDLNQNGGVARPLIYRAAKKAWIGGPIVSWEVGEFQVHDVENEPAVKIRFRSSDDGGLQEQIVVISKYASNVEVHAGTLPAAYQSGLKSAA